jgi:glycosidase
LKRSGTRGDINSVRNAQVRAAIYDVMRFRLGRRIDGFRVEFGS